MKIYKWYLLQIVYQKNHTNNYVGLFNFFVKISYKKLYYGKRDDSQQKNFDIIINDFLN